MLWLFILVQLVAKIFDKQANTYNFPHIKQIANITIMFANISTLTSFSENGR